ncbi:DUF1896 domain-containing protein [Flavobacterium dauae]|uniref:DUF1896 domain-containing protein n=1 Tax=Flavobacterium dauae TaxID=1563479 RepID=UPI00101B3555|nr:DUF1896 domain-containing protein [Flavobacterium dauae]WLD24347.1 DUF1896 domain-containing protein [Flavobacterium dauae]
MSPQQKDLSYFRLTLQELLNESFPEKANDQKFIDQRSSWAANAYEGAFRSGNPISECDRIANYILFAGLHFSRFDAVFQVVCNEFDTLMADEELRPFALAMFPVCEPVFARYELTDDFAYGYEFDQLYTELTGIIALWIEEHGLQ